MSRIERGTELAMFTLKSRAKSELNLRRKQHELFGNGWVSDAWWEFMLILYSSKNGAATDRFTLAGETGQSFELTERWLTLMIDYGYVRRMGSHGSNDLPTHTLTDEGRLRVEQCLGAAGGIASGSD